MEKRLIINADDMGLTRGITDGIVLAHKEGLLTSTSLMVNQSATEYAVELLRKTPTLDAGIHLNLCQGRPVLPASSVPSLVDESGFFLNPAKMGRKLTRWQVSAKEIEAEFRAQIDAMLGYKLIPSHADSHHRYHMYPAAAIAFSRVLAATGIRKARAPRKQHWPNDGFLGSSHAGPLYRRAAVTVYNTFLQSFLFRNLTLPDAGVAFAPQFRGRLDLLPEAWTTTIQHMTAGTYEMWCHPGFAEPGFSETDRLCRQRELEIGILTSPTLRTVVTKAGVKLINFKEL